MDGVNDPCESPDVVRGRTTLLDVIIVGGTLKAASILRMFTESGNVRVRVLVGARRDSPAVRLADDLGIPVTYDLADALRERAIDLILDVSDDSDVRAVLEARKPDGVELLGAAGADLVWELLAAKKRGEEQERLLIELKAAYDQISRHERKLQTSYEALEHVNSELEGRLAEIFFTHEFFKALTRFTGVDKVCALIVDGTNGILGAEISSVYLLARDGAELVLRSSQGRPPEAFEPSVPPAETILGSSLREGVVQEFVSAGAPSLAWMSDPEGVTSQVAVPLRSGEQALGVIVVASTVSRELSTAEIDRLCVIANQSSLALQNALLHEELERLSVTDRLTDLYNHGYFQQRLDTEIKRAERFGHPLALVMADIDDFKGLNDTYGHPRGDAVLKVVAAIVRENLRGIDMAARYGGEEFVVLLPETDADGALLVAERVRARVACEPFVLGKEGRRARVSLSLGVAAYPRHALSPAGLLDAADRALYQAKHAGKNQVKVAL